MATSQGISRGFHRLALFLAAVPFLIGVVLTMLWGLRDANIALDKHQKLVCAHQRAPGTEGQPWTLPWDAFEENPFLPPKLDDVSVSLKKLGCSELEYDAAKVGEIRNVAPAFNWFGAFVPLFATGVAITLAVTLAVYGIVRAIGWVIGGFAAS
jgi:hypothetical protein